MNIKTMTTRAADVERVLKGLANRHRLLILCELNGRERSVAQLVQAIGLSQSALSQHLARLREDGTLSTRRDGTNIFYRLSDPHVVRIVALLYELYCGTETVKDNKRKAQK
jgi:ArsR family transcriptional regulator